jgi:flagellar basal-body rod protein FlgF
MNTRRRTDAYGKRGSTQTHEQQAVNNRSGIVDAMTIASVAMQDDLQRMNSISQNLANVTTPAYKREIATTGAFAGYVGRAFGTGTVPGSRAIVIDPGAGTLRQTGNPLDLAIEGEGYFEVAAEDGPAFTRQGAMHVDARGVLVNASGLPVMGLGGEVSLGGAPITINGEGEIRQGERVIAQIKLVRFANPEALAPVGGGLYRQGTARLADTATVGKLRTGYQENSNVNSAHEMVLLTETVRHFESMQKVMQGYNDAYETAVRKLGEF